MGDLARIALGSVVAIAFSVWFMMVMAKAFFGDDDNWPGGAAA